jgi:hypothetical protein
MRGDLRGAYNCTAFLHESAPPRFWNWSEKSILQVEGVAAVFGLVRHLALIAGNEPRLVDLRGLFPSHTSIGLARLAEKGGQRGASFLRPHRSGKQPCFVLDPGENFRAVAAHEAARCGNRRAGFCRELPCPLDRKTA